MTDKLVEKKVLTAVLKSADILKENGLDEWRIKLNNKRSSLAETYYRDKVISYSKHFVVVATEEQFLGVTLHEVTHALLGKGHGHDKKFRELCEKISPNKDYARRSVGGIGIRKFKLECPSCGYTGTTNKGGTRYCGICFRDNKKTVAFKSSENVLNVTVW